MLQLESLNYAQGWDLLAQVAPSTTNDTTLISGKNYIVKEIYIVNTSAGALTFRLHHRTAAAGTSNALYYDCAIAAKATLQILTNLSIRRLKEEILSCSSSSANNLTFSIFGKELGT